MVSGKWSPIYSQALLVELDNGKRFITNFRYNLKESYLKDPLTGDLSKLSELSTGSEEAFDSECHSTMVGYVQDDYKNSQRASESMKNFKATCFFGQQIEHYDVETTQPVEEGEKKLKFNKITKHNAAASKDLAIQSKPAATSKPAALVASNKTESTPAAPAAPAAPSAPEAASQAQVDEDTLVESSEKQTTSAAETLQSKLMKKSNKKNKRSNLHLEHVPSDEMDLLISTINSADLGWKASTCKLQKHHKDYAKGQNCEDDEMVMISDDVSAAKVNRGPIHP